MRQHMLWQPEVNLNIALVLQPLVGAAGKAQPLGHLDLQPCALLPRVLPCLGTHVRYDLGLLLQLPY